MTFPRSEDYCWEPRLKALGRRQWIGVGRNASRNEGVELPEKASLKNPTSVICTWPGKYCFPEILSELSAEAGLSPNRGKQPEDGSFGSTA